MIRPMLCARDATIGDEVRAVARWQRGHGGTGRCTMAAAAVALIAGCTGSSSSSATPTPPRTATIAPPTPSASPSATADAKAQAYADAEKVYRSFFKGLDSVRRAGGASTGNASKYATANLAGFVDNLAKLYKSRGWHAVGSSTIRSVTPKAYVAAGSDGQPKVVLFTCEDFSTTKVVDRSGKLVVTGKPGDPKVMGNTIDVVRTSTSSWAVDSFKLEANRACPA